MQSESKWKLSLLKSHWQVIGYRTNRFDGREGPIIWSDSHRNYTLHCSRYRPPLCSDFGIERARQRHLTVAACSQWSDFSRLEKWQTWTWFSTWLFSWFAESGDLLENPFNSLLNLLIRRGFTFFVFLISWLLIWKKPCKGNANVALQSCDNWWYNIFKGLCLVKFIYAAKAC